MSKEKVCGEKKPRTESRAAPQKKSEKAKGEIQENYPAQIKKWSLKLS